MFETAAFDARDRGRASPSVGGRGEPDPPPLETCRIYVNGGCGFRKVTSRLPLVVMYGYIVDRSLVMTVACDGGPVEAGQPAGCDVLAWFADPEVAERIAQGGSWCTSNPQPVGCG